VEGSQHQSNASLVCQRGRGCGSDHRFLAFTTAMLPCAAQSLCLGIFPTTALMVVGGEPCQDRRLLSSRLVPSNQLRSWRA